MIAKQNMRLSKLSYKQLHFPQTKSIESINEVKKHEHEQMNVLPSIAPKYVKSPPKKLNKDLLMLNTTLQRPLRYKNLDKRQELEMKVD